MEFEPQPYFPLFYTCFSFLFFFSSLLLLLLLFLFSLRRRLCNCDTCLTFLSRTWSLHFSSLPDWYAHLLSTSPTSTIHIHVLNNIITANPLNVEHILRSHFHNYPKGKPLFLILGDFLGRGIFLADGDSWLFQRKLASLELGSLSIRSFAVEILCFEIHHRLLPLLYSFSSLSPPPVVDLQDVFRRFAFDNICRFSFGVDPGCLNGSLPLPDLAVAFDTASKLSAERALLPAPLLWKIKRFLNIGSERRLKESIQKVNLLAEEIIKERRKMGFKTKRDLLSRFMESITDDMYLRDIVISFLLAGRDTVASGLTLFIYLLAQNPEVESKILEEIGRVLGPMAQNNNSNMNVPSVDQFKEMHYLHAALSETLRLYPPVQIDSKYARNDDVLPDGTWIRKGTRVSYHPYAMGRMERIWGPDFMEFKPERWLDEEGVYRAENPYKYPVFQAGLRVCLGKELALVAMKCVALSIIQRFQVRLVEPGRPPCFLPGLTATLKGGLPVVVREWPERGQ